MKRQILYLALAMLITPLFARQNDNTTWSVTYEDTRSFVENKGQFDRWNGHANGNILYAFDYEGTQVFFTETGVTYRLYSKYRNPNRVKGELGKPKYLYKTDYIHFTWEGASADVELLGDEVEPSYHNYGMVSDDRTRHYAINNIKGYRKVVYKNLYPGIDVVYTIHPEGGVKYDVNLRGGADVSLLKMCYDDGRNIKLDDEGKLHIDTKFGDIIEHKPISIWTMADSETIPSTFNVNGSIVSFELGDYPESIISNSVYPEWNVKIDPWVQTPNLGASSCLWECEVDGAGNVYVIGGELPMRLQKYNSTGVLQWTYNTPWDTANSWLGALATDDAGNSYVTSGSIAEIQKVNTAGALQWTNGPGGLSQDEYWTIAFNCDQTKLIVGGTAFGGGLLVGKIYDINTTNGGVTNSIEINTGYTSLTVLVDEVRALTSSRNAKYYFLTLDGIGAINQDLAICDNEPLFLRRSNYKFSYKSEFFRPENGNAGIEAIIANDQFVYTQNGVNVQKRSLLDGSILTTSPIPGGVSTATLGVNQPGNMGIAVDDCGNVYVGSADRVIKYDGNLNQLMATNVPFKVYDVEVSTNGEVIATGGTGTSNLNTYPRTGYVRSIPMSACTPFALICCNPTICPAGPLCDTDAPITIEAAQAGGTFTGPGITNASTGVFDPSVAGPGTHTIVHTLSCGSDTIEILVNACADLEICEELNGDFTVTGGTGPYTWETGVPFQNCSACPLGQCFPPICTGFPDTTWTTVGSTPTITPPAGRPLRVSDSGINSTTLFAGVVPPPCVLCPNITSTINSQSDVGCGGGNDGTAALSSSGGTGPYTYTWQPGNLTGASQTALTANTYTVIANDANNCKDTITVIINEPTPITSSLTSTPTSCTANDGTATATVGGGTPPYTYLWSNTAITNPATGLAAGVYGVSISDSRGCSVLDSITVGSTNSPSITSIIATDETCAGDGDGSIDLTATGGTAPLSYLWSNAEITEDISSLSPGSYSVTVSDAAGCTVTDNVTVNAGPSCCDLSLSATSVDPSCGASDGEIDLTVLTGSGNYGFVWSNAALTEDLTGVMAGSYSVTVTDNVQSCSLDTTISLSSASGPVINNISATDETCLGDGDGTATVDATGGNPPLTYDWSNGDTSATITGLAPGNYDVSVSDIDGCVASANASVGAGPLCCVLDFSLVVDDISCSVTTGTITVSVDTASGTPPFEFSFDGGQTYGTANSQSGLAAGSYTVIVRDANTCSTTQQAAVNSVATVTVDLGPDQFICDGNGVLLDAGNPGLNYIWSTGDTTQTISADITDTYSVTVSDNSGCSASSMVDVSLASVSVDAGGDTVVAQFESIMLMGIPSGDITAGTYSWSPGQSLDCDDCQDPIASPTDTTMYTVTYTDANGCTATDSILIAVMPGEFYWVLPNAFSPNGDDQNDFLYPYFEGVNTYTWRIFDRWGEVVFECTSGGTCIWDGTFRGQELKPSVFVWQASVEFNNRTFVRYHGSLVLLQ